MRRIHAAMFAVCVACSAAIVPPAHTQDGGELRPHYWPHRTVGIPVDVDRIAGLSPKPTDLQLYYSVNRSAFQKGPKLPLNGMQQLDGGKKGFLFAAEKDGDFEFTVQFVYPDGSTSPKAEDLSPQVRTVIDSTPPTIKVAPSGNGVEWRATDDNLDPSGTKLECKWPTSAAWTEVTERPFRASDSFAWKLPAGKTLEVRVVARDRAGNEGVSSVVRVPPETGVGVGLPKTPDWVNNPNLPAPPFQWVNTLDFDVDYTVQKMGRSGIQAMHLFVLKGNGNWELVQRFPVKLMPNDKEHSLSLPYKAKEEGVYGFYVVPESGANTKGPDPRRDDAPMMNVVVDKTPPYIQITGVQVQRGARGPVVEINWKAADPNLMPEPISLEWSTDAKAGKWNEIKYRLKNNLTRETGRYAWEVPDPELWKFYIRARAVDKASNTGEHVWGTRDGDKDKPAEVIVDLDTPSATINKVRGGNTPKTPPGGSDAPPKKMPDGGGPSLPPLPGGGPMEPP